jgi:trehalose-6-phosphate synthase
VISPLDHFSPASAIAKLDRLKGLQLTLQGIDEFLKCYPHFIQILTFVVIGISASEMGEEYVRTRRDVNSLVKHLNKLYPGVMTFEEKNKSQFDLTDRLSFYSVSDILIVGGIRCLFISLFSFFR